MKKVDLPALNWFIHVLTKNISKTEWVNKTPEEFAESDNDYPYKVVHTPIPEGKDIVLDDGKYQIHCNDQFVKDLIIELAKSHKKTEEEKNRLSEVSDPWHPSSEIPDGQHSSCYRRKLLVYSPVLLYIMPNGIIEGFHDNRNDTWYIKHNGKDIPHEVTHWRYLPPGPGGEREYNKEKVEALKKAME